MNTNDEQILKDSIFKIGKVVSVRGRFIEVKVDKVKNSSNLLYKGNLLKNVSVGGYVKIIKGFTKIIGKVEGEYVNENENFAKKRYKNDEEKINRILNISLLGFFNENIFERGIKELPLIDNECFLLEEKEFEQVHDFIRNGDEPICIGTLSLEKGKDINIGVDALFASHIGIFGNTGSGKSYTLAKIYRELFDKYKDNENFTKRAKFILIDFNGEYIGDNVIVDSKYKNTYNLSTRKDEEGDKFPIREDVVNDATFWNIFLIATEKTQAPFIRRALANKNINGEKINNFIMDVITSDDRKIERGVIFNFLEDIRIFLNVDMNMQELKKNLKYHSTSETFKIYSAEKNVFVYANENPHEVLNNIKKYLFVDNDFVIKEKLSYLQKIYFKMIYYYYDEIIRGYSNQEHLRPLIKRLEKRIDKLEKVIQVSDLKLKNFLTVISFKKTDSDITKILPLLICKQLYDFKKQENKKEEYLNFIIDEAHNILSHSSERESEIWKDYRLENFEEIVKEGRKFGVFLTIASQRPSDISSTIISQLHNFFLHRLINNNDILMVEKTISYLDKVSFEYLPILPTGTCILAGLLAQVPVVIDIASIKKGYEPDNDTIKLVNSWKQYDRNNN